MREVPSSSKVVICEDAEALGRLPNSFNRPICNKYPGVGSSSPVSRPSALQHSDLTLPGEEVQFVPADHPQKRKGSNSSEERH